MEDKIAPKRAAAVAELARENRIRVKNRRKRYLETHPEYFNAELELANPLLYDRLIRQYQSPAEREAEGRAKGPKGIIEADIVRAFAKRAAIDEPDPNAVFQYKRNTEGAIVINEVEIGREFEKMDKDEALKIWKWEMEMRFVHGHDEEFDYGTVDYNDEFDGGELERDREEKYFEEMEIRTEREDGTPLQGQTGIQDY